MELKFITSLTKGYWNSVGKACMSTWQLPGEVYVYIDQKSGSLDWIDEIPYKKILLHVPPLEVAEYIDVKTKVRKFWGKSNAQFDAVRNREDDTRVVWLDADMEQKTKIPKDAFTFSFPQAVAMMRSSTKIADRFETGLVIFNQEHEKLNLFIKQYEAFWKNDEELLTLLRPYDAMVLGTLAEKRGFHNLCRSECDNINALKNTKFADYFRHWINKENKAKLKEINEIS